MIYRTLLCTLLLAAAALSVTGHKIYAQDFTLAVTWQPAFCQRMPRLPECQSQTADRIDARQFSLHGLWPAPRGNVYCDVARPAVELSRRGEWLRFAPLDLPEDLRARLAAAMPGVQSGLDRHEWIKHGTCHTVPEVVTYYEHALALLDALNASRLDEMFYQSAGSILHADTIRAAADLAFGDGAGERIQIVCRTFGPHELIVELRLSLRGDPSAPLATLLNAAPPRKTGCRKGLVDAVGLR